MSNKKEEIRRILEDALPAAEHIEESDWKRPQFVFNGPVTVHLSIGNDKLFEEENP